MYEALTLGEAYQPGEQITHELTDWLLTEIQTSSDPNNINSYLDDWEKFQSDLRLPFGHPDNQDALKANGHYDRFALNIREAKANPSIYSDDHFMAKQDFFGKMFLSGSWRQQCMLQSSSGEEYMQRRLHDGPVGIDIQAVVSERMFQLYCSSRPTSEELSQQMITVESLISDSTAVNEARIRSVEFIHEHPENAGLNESSSVDMLRITQRMLAKLAVDHVLFAAQERGGDLSKVPSMMPVSITSNKQKIYYPYEKA
jgi:hypothetical protein